MFIVTLLSPTAAGVKAFLSVKHGCSAWVLMLKFEKNI
jgi:hypothetical protein